MKGIDHEALALKSRRTKIIATLGPASSSPAVISQLLAAGMDVVRLNMSHGTHDSHRTLFKRVRAAARRAQQHVAVVMDLCGPKIRVGRFAEGEIQLAAGDEVIVTSRHVMGVTGLIPSQYRQLHKDVKKDERVLLDDGNLELRVLAVDGTEVACRVIHGGLLKDHKGMNLPDSVLSTPAFTNKDKKDVLLAMELEVEYVALSFVRNAGDVTRLKRYMARHGEPIPVISKIERPEAVENLDEILEASDGVMVARGDLGIELPAERVPMIQRNIIKRARAAYVPVIVATQMLESMMTHSRPTRAEVGDVASAAHSSADAVMLSGETASGAYPVAAVETMDRVAREIEKHQWHDGQYGSQVFADRHRNGFSLREAVSHAALELARDMAMQAILVPTRSGTTARILSAHRTTVPLVGICANARICRRLSLHWGVIPVFVKEPQLHDWHGLCHDIESQCDLSRPGHTVLLVSGFSDNPACNEPVLKTLTI